jgi:hypothetical protein
MSVRSSRAGLSASRSWNVRDAKAHLSEVVSGALEQPQRIARRDGATVVVLNEQAYLDLLDAAEEQVDMVDYFRRHAIDGDDLPLPPRHASRGRPPLG